MVVVLGSLSPVEVEYGGDYYLKQLETLLLTLNFGNFLANTLAYAPPHSLKHQTSKGSRSRGLAFTFAARDRALLKCTIDIVTGVIVTTGV